MKAVVQTIARNDRDLPRAKAPKCTQYSARSARLSRVQVRLTESQKGGLCSEEVAMVVDIVVVKSNEDLC